MPQLDDAQRILAATRLRTAELSGEVAGRLSDEFPGMDVADAYAIQAKVADARRAAGDQVIGYKIGLTSKAMQDAVGIDEPDYGHLFASHRFHDGAAIPVGRLHAPRIEVELAFVLDRPLRGPGVGVSDVLAATRHVLPALELIASRTTLPRKLVDTLSDNAAGAGIVLGGRVIEPFDMDLRWLGAILYRNAAIVETGLAAAILGHPAAGIAWLANRLGPQGITLEPGQLLLAGSFTRPVEVAPGDVVHVDYGPLGGIAITFTR